MDENTHQSLEGMDWQAFVRHIRPDRNTPPDVMRERIVERLPMIPEYAHEQILRLATMLPLFVWHALSGQVQSMVLGTPSTGTLPRILVHIKQVVEPLDELADGLKVMSSIVRHLHPSEIREVMAPTVESMRPFTVELSMLRMKLANADRALAALSQAVIDPLGMNEAGQKKSKKKNPPA